MEAGRTAAGLELAIMKAWIKTSEIDSTASRDRHRGALEQPAGSTGTPPPALEDKEREARPTGQPTTSKQQDRVPRGPFAKRIADTIVKRTDPSR